MNSIVELAAHERFRRDANSARAKTNMKSAKQRRLRCHSAAVAVAQQHKAAVSAHRLQARSSRS